MLAFVPCYVLSMMHDSINLTFLALLVILAFDSGFILCVSCASLFPGEEEVYLRSEKDDVIELSSKSVN